MNTETETKNVKFSLSGSVRGTSISPQAIPLDLLRDFAEDVADLVATEKTKGKAAVPLATVEAGSFRLVVNLSASAALALSTQIGYFRNGTWEFLQPKTKEVLESWQDRAKKEDVVYEVSDFGPSEPLRLSRTEVFAAKEQSIFYPTELYLTGKLISFGGAKPNLHLSDTQISATQITIKANEEQLKSLKENRIYQQVSVRVKASQSLLDDKLKDFELIEFVDYRPHYDPVELGAANERVSAELSHLGDLDAWLAELRS